MKKKLSFIIIFLLILICPSFASDQLLLPVYKYGKDIIVLSVSSPVNFFALQDFQQGMKQGYFKYVYPNNVNDPSKITEIFTARTMIGKKLSAEYIKNGSLNEYQTKSKVEKVFINKVENFKKYQKATLALTYIFNSEKTFEYMVYYSGPFDCSCVLYTIFAKSGLSDQAAFMKAREFINNNVKLIDSANQ